ncbi:MAG: hypothetical protein BMS9Abin17_1072 [Acidimicrobiia bacterium]|nr:MAG: hypothetical protein BMS9Abin17_1072 [Acidimicrobiia bacterium]
MDGESELREALIRVPGLLLSTDDEAVRADALFSLDVHKRLTEDVAVVALVGPSGAGRSWLFNRLVKAAVSPVGPIRPTTTGLVAASTQDVVVTEVEVEVQIAPAGPDGIVLIDTPAWEHQPDVVRSVVARADAAVVVVSPSRYADASVAELWAEVSDKALLVLNRADPDPSMLELLHESVTGIFGCEPVVIHDGQAEISDLEDLLSARTSQDNTPMRAITLAAARSAATYLARATAKMATDVQDVSLAVRQEEPFAVPPAVLSVSESWLATKQSMVEAVAKEIRDSDDRIVSRARSALGDRLLADMGLWGEKVLDVDLDLWRERCRELFVDEASIRWRRGPAEHLIDNYSWKIAINSNVVAPRRFNKILGRRRDDVAAVAHDELEILLAGSVEERRRRWSETLDTLGAYQPGILLALAGSAPGAEAGNG